MTGFDSDRGPEQATRPPIPAASAVGIDLDRPERALAVAAHPDDAEFGCGATVAKWSAAGSAVSLLVLTDGSKGAWDPGADIAALIDRRRQEQRDAARRLGATGEVVFLDQTDGELVASLELRSRVARVIRELRPGVVLGHDPWRRWRLHPDHRAAGFLCADAVAAARDPHFYPEHGLPPHRPDRLLLFECEEPDHVERVEEAHVEAKIEALMAHRSQYESTHAIRPGDGGAGRAAFRARIVDGCRRAGEPVGAAYAEAFRLVPTG